MSVAARAMISIFMDCHVRYRARETMEERDKRFAHLLQPIRDLAKNWDIDIAGQLEEYLSEVGDRATRSRFVWTLLVCVSGYSLSNPSFTCQLTTVEDKIERVPWCICDNAYRIY